MAFDLYDKDGDGKITYKDLKEAFDTNDHLICPKLGEELQRMADFLFKCFKLNPKLMFIDFKAF